MGLLSKLRVTYHRPVGTLAASSGKASAPAGRAEPAYAPRGGRPSNGLKDFLWHLDGIAHGSLLDLGPVWQSTVSFFIERGFKVYTEDLLGAWKEFQRVEEEPLQALPPGEEPGEISPAARAQRFLESSLQYPPETFDAMLAWDLLDHLENDLATRVVARLAELLKEGGVILALFHSRKPEGFHRYRIVDPQTIQLVPAPAPVPLQHTLQNREVLNLFSRFRSSKTLIGRDQLREGLFRK